MSRKTLKIRDAGCEKQSGGHPHAPLDAILSNVTMPRPETLASTIDNNKQITGIVIGKLIKSDKKKIPMVDYPFSPSGVPVAALTTVSVTPEDFGREVALGFVGGNPDVPIILGFMHHFPQTVSGQDVPSVAEKHDVKTLVVEQDGETVTISAERQIVLRCGESSITLTRAGKVITRGAYLLNRSSGTIKIQGGSVLIN